MTTADGTIATLIFLGVANSARSQMAEGLARASAPEGWRVFSAGSEPSLVHPLAIEALREVGVDISGQRSKGMADVPLDEANVVVTLCEEEICPTVPGKAQHISWNMPDPAAKGEMIRHQMDAFRSARDEIRRRLDAFWAQHAARS